MSLRAAVADTASVLRSGGRAILRHWPTLLAIYLAGAAVRYAALWLVVLSSRVNINLALLVLPLAPIATLTALYLMLRVVQPSLEGGAGAATVVSGRERLATWSAVLVPFLVLYAGQGYLDDDTATFRNLVFADAIQKYGVYSYRSAYESFGIVDGIPLLILVAVAFAIRRIVDRFDLAERHPGWGFAAGYVEVLWMVFAAKAIARWIGSGKDWVFERKAVDTLVTWWQGVIDNLGWLSGPVRWVSDGITNLLGNADVMFVVPIAWLVTGAVVYQRQVHGELDLAAPGEWVRSRQRRLPGPVRKWSSEAASSAFSRFSGVLDGIKVMTVAGFAPVMLFCLAFVLVRQVNYGVAELLRLVVGPRQGTTFHSLSPYVTTFADAAYTVVLAGLLGAAIFRIGRQVPVDGEAAPATA